MTHPVGSEAAVRRARPAEVGAVFAPRSVAVVGASSDPTRFTGKIIPSLLRHGFEGAVYPVNAKRAELQGLPCYPNLAGIPGPVDCVVYGLAPGQALAALQGGEAKGVKLLVVASAGFAETGEPEGRALQDELVAFARARGSRVLGPNCIGFANFARRTCVSAAAVLDRPDIPVGRIGLVTQSGGLGFATVIHDALEEGIGFSHIVSTGNEADLDTIDVARWLVEDPDTDVVTMTVEAVRDTAAFIALAVRAGAVGKPLVVLKSGRTELGKAMAQSHTGALAGSAAVFDAVCAQYGIVVARDVDDFYQIAAMFTKLRAAGKLRGLRGSGRRCAALSLSGGHVGLFADHASREGLSFPPFSPELRRRVAGALGFEGNFQNPLDTTARVIGDDGFWGRCVKVLLEDDAIGAVVPIITVARSYDPAIRDLISLAAGTPKPLVVVWAGGHFAGEGRRLLQESAVPVFRTPSRAAEAVAALDRWCDVWNRPEAETPAATASARPVPAAARVLLQEAVAAGRRSMTERESKGVLAALGIPVTREAAAATEAEAVAAARGIGYPVAAKGEHPDIQHKSDADLVLLDLRDDAAVRGAFRTLEGRMAATAAPSAAPGRVLVQEMVPPGTELILGITADREFGRVVLVGTGGIFAEVLEDVAMRLPPFDDAEARRMIAALRGAKLLDGARGRGPVDRAALANILVRLGDFAAANADLVAEMDINPLVAAGGRLVAVDALIVLRGPLSET